MVHRPGESPKQSPPQIQGQRHSTSTEVARSSTCKPRSRATAASHPLRTPPEHQPKRQPQRKHQHRRKHQWSRAAASRRRRRRRRERGEAAPQQNDDGGLPASTPTPEIHPIHTLSTPPERRSGDSPSSRRRSDRRRVGNPTDTPADAGETGVALEFASGTVDREGGREFYQ